MTTMVYTHRKNLCAVAMLAAALTTYAQGRPGEQKGEVDLAVTGNAQRGTSLGGQSFFSEGGGVEVSGTLPSGVGMAADFTGVSSATIGTGGQRLVTVFAGMGPRYTWSRPGGRLAIFGQVLAGGTAAYGGVFPVPSGSVTNSSAKFATQIGGGVDLRMGRFAVRPFQADWVRTQFPNGYGNKQNSLRLGAGLVFRLHR